MSSASVQRSQTFSTANKHYHGNLTERPANNAPNTMATGWRERGRRRDLLDVCLFTERERKRGKKGRERWGMECGRGGGE